MKYYRSVYAVWGFFSGLFISIVPEIGLSFLLIKEQKRTLHAFISAFVGVILGYTAVYVWMHFSPTTYERLLELVPNLTEIAFNKLVVSVQFLGKKELPILTRYFFNYQVFVAAASKAKIDMGWVLLLYSVLTLIRMAIAVVMTAFIKRLKVPRAELVILGLWTLIYIFYFLA